jgi:hypothetical protein
MTSTRFKNGRTVSNTLSTPFVRQARRTTYSCPDPPMLAHRHSPLRLDPTSFRSPTLLVEPTSSSLMVCFHIKTHLIDNNTLTVLLQIVHKYLDSDNSGTHSNCVTNNTGVLQTLVTWLQQNGNRQSLLSETGGGSTDSSCET